MLNKCYIFAISKMPKIYTYEKTDFINESVFYFLFIYI